MKKASSTLRPAFLLYNPGISKTESLRMLFRHSEAFLFIRFGPVLPLQHHAPPTLSHRPLLSFHSTPVPLLPLIHSAPPGPPAAPLRLSCSPSPHSMAIFPIHSFRSASSSPPPVPALPLRSTLHLQLRQTLSTGHGSIPSQSIPDQNTVEQRHSNPSKKQKTERRGRRIQTHRAECP